MCASNSSPVTIKDIARRAGVSHSTVSRALHGSSSISEETTERIRLISQEMGYHPSAAARSLKTNQTKALGVIVRNIDDPFFSEILQGIEDIAQSEGYSLFTSSSQNEAARERTIVKAMREHRVDGVIICSTSFNSSQSRELTEQNIPIVVVNNQAAEDYRYAIHHDDMDGSRQLTRHLIKLGHQHIAYLGNSISGRTTLDRLAGYVEEMKSAGLVIPEAYIHQVAGGELEHGLAGAGHFLSLPQRPTALVCYNDLMAIGVLRGLQMAGRSVPQEISVTGFDNLAISAYTHPPLTTFDQPKHYLGVEAARLLLGLLKSDPDERNTTLQSRTLKGRLLVRASSAPPPGQENR